MSDAPINPNILAEIKRIAGIIASSINLITVFGTIKFYRRGNLRWVSIKGETIADDFACDKIVISLRR